MEDTAPASELERRKQLRLRLRRDLSIEPHKYEGRTYFVIKDPISLRYYRLKENEHFLLQFMDGGHTLEDAQKAYEAQYRPDRLKLEDVEGFAQQLINGGLAQNDSPRRQAALRAAQEEARQEWIQTFTNILYIKIPIIDPDRLLGRMVPWLGWIFTPLFLMASIVLMGSAIGLVAVNFNKFLDKLPDYHEFFSFKTVVYLWGALAVVKVIHEFGHGLSCKKFGGEVHEMGFLLLCLSPALYCNVSDAWTLPNKWHRIIISAAGIYVELVIAAIATWVWWYTPTQPFIHNLALAMMVVCSVSTVVFNANPLMRYDGYYVLADWLEIPNLRERSNRFLSNLVLDWCLGVEVQPESYMALWRRILFVFYAITSYVYKWLVTFGIIWFFTAFLKPYKLEVVGEMLAVAAVASMLCWPIYRLGKNIYKRGRLPDMKRWRVVATGLALTAVVLFLALVPLPLNKVRGKGLVEALPDASAKVFVRYPGVLEKLNVHTGQKVEQGEELAVFRNIELEQRLAEAATDETASAENVLHDEQGRETMAAGQARDDLTQKIAEEAGKRDSAASLRKALDKIKREELVLLAPRRHGRPGADDRRRRQVLRTQRGPAVLHHRRAGQGARLPAAADDRVQPSQGQPGAELSGFLRGAAALAARRDGPLPRRAAGRRVRRPGASGPRPAPQGRRGGGGARRPAGDVRFGSAAAVGSAGSDVRADRPGLRGAVEGRRGGRRLAAGAGGRRARLRRGAASAGRPGRDDLRRGPDVARF